MQLLECPTNGEKETRVVVPRAICYTSQSEVLRLMVEVELYRLIEAELMKALLIETDLIALPADRSGVVEVNCSAC